MTLDRVLLKARQDLARRSVEDAGLEAELLLRQVLGVSRVELYQDFHRELSPQAEADFGRLIERRLRGEPVAYLTGHREFYGLDFYVDPAVLIPRLETELVIDRALAIARKRPVATVADIGTGSGAMAVALAVNLPQVKIYATDVSPAALRVARLNCQRHGVAGRVCLLEGDLLAPLPEPVDLIAANLPYVTESEVRRQGLADYEPEVALNGGCDGLDEVWRLCRGLGGKLRDRGSLLLEIGIGQSGAVAEFLGGLYPRAELEIMPDLSGIDRVVSLTFEEAGLSG